MTDQQRDGGVVQATVIVGLTAADAARRLELQAAVDHVRAAGAIPLSIAFLQLADPPLVTELDRLTVAGARDVRLIGVSLDPRRTTRSWLLRVAAHWLRTVDGPAPQLRVAPELITGTTVRDIADAVGADSDDRPVADTVAPLVSSAWEEIPAHRHQVFVCRGPRCAAKGSAQVLDALNAALRERDLGDHDVLVTATGCQFPCNHAPLISVQPADTWFGRMTPDAAATLADTLTVDFPDALPADLAAHRLPRTQRNSAGPS